MPHTELSLHNRHWVSYIVYVLPLNPPITVFYVGRNYPRPHTY